MGISLSNHENRIKVLENKSFGGYRAVYPNGTKSIDVNNLINQGYNIFIPMSNPHCDTCNMINTPILVPEIASVYQATHHYEYENTVGGQNIKLSGGVITSSPIGSRTSKMEIYALIALKLYYNFSYNIYHLICTFLESLFEEV